LRAFARPCSTGVAALSSLAAWTKLRRTEIEGRLELPERLLRARHLLELGRADGALELASAVALQARSNATANEAWHLAAWAELELGQPREAGSSLQLVVPSHKVDPFCLAATEAALGRSARAVAVLETARVEHGLGAAATKLLIDSYAHLRRFANACAVARDALDVLEPTDTRRVIEAAFAQGAIAPGTELAAALFQRTSTAEDAALHAQGLARLREPSPGPQDSAALRDSVV